MFLCSHKNAAYRVLGACKVVPFFPSPAGRRCPEEADEEEPCMIQRRREIVGSFPHPALPRHPLSAGEGKYEWPSKRPNKRMLNMQSPYTPHGCKITPRRV